MRLIHNTRKIIALERSGVGNGNEIQIDSGTVGSELTFEDNAWCLGNVLGFIIGSRHKEADIITRKQHIRPVLDEPETSLSPIEIKVEENSAASPCSSYLEQQPSTSTVAAHPASSIPSATAHSTPRSSSAAGVESSVERVARQEAQVLARIAELRRQGLWTASRLPMIEMPPRNKTHWDYLLEEMRWMAIDFRQERTFKRQAAKKFSSQIARMLRDREQEKERSEQRAVREAKRICALIAKMIRDFWQNVDRVVDLRAQEIIESMKRKALDQQLEMMVGHADKLSEMVQEGLIGEKSSKASSPLSGDNIKDEDAASFSTDSDDISLSDTEAVDGNVDEEMQGLMAEGNLELDDFLDSLPPGYLESFSKSEHRNLFEHMPGTSADYKHPEGSEVSTEYTASEITQEEALKFQPKGFTLETTQVKTEVPHLVKGALREYQMVGLDWLVTLYDNGLNGILADEMGLGKTIQTIALLAHLACKEYVWGPHLIIVPTSVILNWEMEFKKWCPAFKLLTYFGNQKERAEKRKGWSKTNAFHICITSYKIVTQDIRSFKHKSWQYFILDEAQNIKNFKSQRWQTLLNIRARRRLLLTGTPLQNSLMELWSLMHFLMPAIFASHNDFKDWFSNPLNDMMEGNAEWNAPLIQRLHKVLRPFILRRLKSDVEKQLPEKTEHIIKCPLSKRQRCLYDDFMSRRSTRENLRSGSVMSVLNIVMQLRKCCNHPNLFEPRPILSPFVMQRLTITLPGMLLNICQGEGHRLAIDEQMLNDYLSSPVDVPMPNLEGFHFSRPPPVTTASTTTNEGRIKSFYASSVTSSRHPTGNELYVSVDDLGNARVYQLVVDSTGGHTVRECEPSSVAGSRFLVSGTTTSHSAASVVPITRTSTGTSAQPTLQTSSKLCPSKQTAIEPTTTSSATTLSFLKPAFRSTTVLSQTRSSTDTSAKNTGTVNNGCTSLPESHIAATFPISRAQQVKLLEPESASVGSVGTAIDINRVQVEMMEVDEIKPATPAEQADEKSSIYDFLVLPNTSRAMEQIKAERLQRCAAVCSRRLLFPNVCRTPLVSDELLSVIRRELGRKKHRRCNLSVTDSLEWLTQSLVDWTSDASQRFTVFVHGALADEPLLQINTTGCYSYVRKEWDDLNEQCHRVVLDSDRLFSYIDMMQKLQFPELRLIEYDCGKLQVLNSLLRDLFLYKHRCLIFTQMARVLDILQAFLSFHGYQYFRLDGTTGIEQRQAMTERFNADSKIFCFILSTRSGGIGVNLTGADTVIFYDSDWNPTMDAQAQDRCHRIGQTRNVTIYRLVSERTIEENILRKAMQKRRLGEMAIDEAGFTPEFFKGDNVRDLFEGVANVDDVVAPVAITDNKEIEKAMATVEDIQDVYAAQRANAEVEADIAEFDENALIPSIENSQEKIESKYLELINQLKPIERYAVNFLEAEYKPEFEEEVKEAKAMIDSKKDEWMKAQEDVMEEDSGEQQSDDEISLTYLSGFDVPGSVDEIKATQSISESAITNKTVVTKLKKTTDKINMQIKSESEINRSSLVPKSQPKLIPQKLSTEKLPKVALSRQTKLGVKESSCARVVPLSVAFTKASTATRCITSSTHTSNSPISSFNTSSFSLLSSTSSNSRASSRVSTLTNYSPPLSASCSVFGDDRTSLMHHQTFSAPSVTSSYRSSQQLRTTPGPSKFSAQATMIRRRCESGNFEFVKPVSSAYKASSHHQSLSGLRIKPTLGDYERPRLYLRKRGESRSGEMNLRPLPMRVICLDIPGEEMLTWLPPSPPPSDSGDDIYYDSTGEYWFEQLPMAESRLPTTIHELHRPRPLTPISLIPEQFVPEIIVPPSVPYQLAQGAVTSNVAMPPIVALPPSPTGMCTVASGIVRDIVSSPTASLSSISHERGINLIPQTGVSSGAAYLDTSNLLRPATPSRLPGSVDDAIDSVRKSAQKALSLQGTQRSQTGSGRPSLLDSRCGKTELRRPFTPPPRYREAIDYDGSEWSIAEDYETLMILTELQRLPNHLHSSKIGQYANWDMVSVLLATSSEIYRSPRQCSLHYQMVVQPREEGRMVTLDPITKKTRRVPLSTGEMIHMKRGRTKTDQQYLADILKLMSSQYDKKAKALKAASLKQTVLFRPQMADDDVEKWCPTQSHELKFAELGIRYDATTTCSEVVDYRNERREKLREQDRERLRLKEEEEQRREAMLMEQQRSHEQKLIRKESAVTAIPGIIHYQKVSYGAVMEHAQQQLTAVSSPVITTPAVSTVRTYTAGSCVQGQLASTMSGQGTAYSSDAPQVIVSQRAYVDHPQVVSDFGTSNYYKIRGLSAVSGAAPGAHQISTRRVAISVGSGTSTQHQIIMTGGTQIGSSGGQQPYAVVVNSQDTLPVQQLGNRFQYTTRQEGVGERQTQKMFQIATGYGTSPETSQQIYATTSHAGRTLIMSQGDGSQLNETSQIQMIRPQIQTAGVALRQDARSKINQRPPGRLYVTTAAGDRTYLMPQSQVRMMPSGQRITPKRTAGAIHAKTIGGQQQVAMMLPRGGPVQQIRTIPRNIGYQSSRVPSIGLVMSGSSRSENVTGSATTKQLSSAGGISRQTISSASSNTRQVTVAVQGVNSSAPTILQDHPVTIPAQQTQYLPPITLSNQASVQQRYITSQPQGGNVSTPSVGSTTGGMPPSHTDIS
ncbi:Helicase domino [Dirofilaria immitis]|nr:Helicase domino [Dirofilaria immitis]